MFETLSERLSGILDKITGRGALSESDVEDALREVRRALLEADVALEVVKTFTEKVKAKAVGAEIVKSIKPGQMVVKIVHDALVETLGGSEGVGPQSAGRAAGADPDGGPAGLGQDDDHRQDRQAPAASATSASVLMASLDTRRPAAQEQLGGARAARPSVDTLADRRGRDAGARSRSAPCRKRARAASTWSCSTRRGASTSTRSCWPKRRRCATSREPKETLAGRRRADRPGRREPGAPQLRREDVGMHRHSARPASTATAAVRAALPMRAVTGREADQASWARARRLDGLEDFHRERIAGRILGMGDVVGAGRAGRPRVSMPGQGQEDRRADDARAPFDLEDLADQLRQLQKLGGMGGRDGSCCPAWARSRSRLDGARPRQRAC